MIHELQNIVACRSTEVRKVSDFIFNNPELGLQEFKACGIVAEFLRSNGFQTTTGTGGLDTSVKAWFINNPRPDTPAVCIIAEYDALQGFGHGCGHNLITAATLAAALATAEYAVKHNLSLRLCVMGTPGEESFGGKVTMIKNGVFDDIDMAIMSHPSSQILPEVGALGVARAIISFHGKASHAGAAPEEGINALDALHYFYADMLEWKKTIDPRERVHGIFTNGGSAPNIIPDYTEAYFYVRSPEVSGLQKLCSLLENSARTGAAKTGCSYEVKWMIPYMPIKSNSALNRRYLDIWHAMDIPVPETSTLESCGSTDMGDVTQVLPGAHFHFNATGGVPCSLHSEEFRKMAGSDTGFAGAMQTAPVLAKLLLDYTLDSGFREQVNKDFSKTI